MGSVVVAVGIHHGNGGLQQAVGNGIFEQGHPVIANFIQAGLADELGKVFLAAKDGIFETSVNESITVTLEPPVDNLEDTDALFGGDIFHIGLQHLFANKPFHFRERDGREILVGCNLQTVGSGFDLDFVFAFQSGDQCGGTRNFHKVKSGNQRFLNGLLMIEGAAAVFYDVAYLIEGFLIGTVVQGTPTCQKLFLLCAFRIQYFQADKPFVHADCILPVVGGRGILACIVDAYGIVLQHLFHKSFLADVAHVMAHEVGGLHTFFHFIGNHVAPVTSGKSHNECEVAFAIAGKADGEMLLYL